MATKMLWMNELREQEVLVEGESATNPGFSVCELLDGTPILIPTENLVSLESED